MFSAFIAWAFVQTVEVEPAAWAADAFSAVCLNAGRETDAMARAAEAFGLTEENPAEVGPTVVYAMLGVRGRVWSLDLDADQVIYVFDAFGSRTCQLISEDADPIEASRRTKDLIVAQLGLEMTHEVEGMGQNFGPLDAPRVIQWSDQPAGMAATYLSANYLLD